MVVGTLIAGVTVFLALLMVGLRWQVTPALAGTSETPTSVIEHVGRKSGRTYETPIDIVESPTGLLIALPYGTSQFVHLERS